MAIASAHEGVAAIAVPSSQSQAPDAHLVAEGVLPTFLYLKLVSRLFAQPNPCVGGVRPC